MWVAIAPNRLFVTILRTSHGPAGKVNPEPYLGSWDLVGKVICTIYWATITDKYRDIFVILVTYK